MNKYILTVMLLCLCAQVQGAEVAGVKLADKEQVGDSYLQLNGAGLRTKLFFKVYVGALYLPQKQGSAAAIFANGHVNRVALHLLREMSSEKLLNAFNVAIEANHTPAELAALDAQLKQMAQIFGMVKEVKSGDVITLDYLPASGTQISMNGVLKGTIAGAAFNTALLKIWLGNKPVQNDLKFKLLGLQ